MSHGSVAAWLDAPRLLRVLIRGNQQPPMVHISKMECFWWGLGVSVDVFEQRVHDWSSISS